MNVIGEDLKPRFRLLQFTLPIRESPRLLCLLALEGISATTLFRGYGGVVKAFDEETFWDRLPPSIAGSVPTPLKQILAGEAKYDHSTELGPLPKPTRKAGALAVDRKLLLVASFYRSGREGC